MKNSPFSPSAIFFLVACGTALFALSLLLHTSGFSPEEGTLSSDYSRSAIGYAGFYDLLKRSDRPIFPGNTQTRLGRENQGTFIFLAPSSNAIKDFKKTNFMQAARLIVVLPKWKGIKGKSNDEGWIDDVYLLPMMEIQEMLRFIADSSSEIFYKPWPEEWGINKIGFDPKGDGNIQLIKSKTIQPVVANENGILIGEIQHFKKGKMWIVADPDVLSNHGIFNGNNAAFMLTLVDKMRFWNNKSKDAPIIWFDFLKKGKKTEESPADLLFKFPFSTISILSCCFIILVLWAGVRRFGVPRQEKPPLDFGKAGLIENGARLLDYGGHQAMTLKRYVQMTIRSVALALHAPESMDLEALVSWLDHVGKARGVKQLCEPIVQSSLHSEKNLQQLFECAQAIHRWKGEILNGSSIDR